MLKNRWENKLTQINYKRKEMTTRSTKLPIYKQMANSKFQRYKLGPQIYITIQLRNTTQRTICTKLPTYKQMANSKFQSYMFWTP